MKRLPLAVFMVLQCAALSGFAASPYATKAESSASESYGPDGEVQTTVNTSFAFTNLYNPKIQSFTNALISLRIANTSFSGRAAANPKLEATAWVSGKGKYDTKLWTINECADAGWQSGDFFWTSKYGFDGTDNLLRAYNLKSGKFAFSFTTDPASVEIAVPNNSVKRYFSYLAKLTKESECRKNELPGNAVGSLTLSDLDTQIDRIVFEGSDDYLVRNPKVMLISDKEAKGTSSLSVWGPADFASTSEIVKGFSVKVLFRDGLEAIIPVTNDRFDIQRASLPKSIKVRRVDVAKTTASKE